MLTGINIKKGLSSAVFSVAMLATLIYIIERPTNQNTFTFGISSSSSGEITVSSSQNDGLHKVKEQFSFEEGSSVFSFTGADEDRIALKFTEFNERDTLQFQGLKFEGGHVNSFWSDLVDVPGLRMEGVDYEPQTQSFFLTSPTLEFSFDATEIYGQKTFIKIKRTAIYIILFLLIFAVLFFTFKRVDVLSWRNLIMYHVFGLILAGAVYFSFRYLTDYPDRTEVVVNWSNKTTGLYSIDFIPRAGKIDSGGELVNPANRFAKPTQLKAERPFYSFRINLESPENHFHLKSVELKNALFSYEITAIEFQDYFPLRNDLRIAYNRENGFVELVPDGSSPAIYLAKPELWLYRLGDKLLYRAHIILSLGLWLFIFLFLTHLHGQKRVKGIKDVWFGLVFLIMLFLPGTIWLISLQTNYFKEERRKAIPISSVCNGDVNQWPDQMENYLADHFGARSSLISLNNLYKVVIFNEVNTTNRAVVKNGDWLFLEGEDSGDYIRNSIPLSTDELKIIEQNLIERKTWLNHHGTDFYITFAPLKSTVYSEEVPDVLKPVNSPSRLHTTLEYLKRNTDLKTIDLTPMLLEKKKSHQLYFKRDTHWNFLGAFFGYQVIIDSLNNDYPQIGEPKKIEDYTISRSKSEDADLARLLGLEKVLLREEVFLSPNFKTHFERVSSESFENLTTLDETVSFKDDQASNDLEIFYFRDSYTNYLIPFLNNHSKSSVYIWTPTFPTEAFESGYPDIAVYIMTERYFHNLLYENSPEVKRFYKNYTDSINSISSDKSELP